jgi:hypothetical protein
LRFSKRRQARSLRLPEHQSIGKPIKSIKPMKQQD